MLKANPPLTTDPAISIYYFCEIFWPRVGALLCFKYPPFRSYSPPEEGNTSSIHLE